MIPGIKIIGFLLFTAIFPAWGNPGYAQQDKNFNSTHGRFSISFSGTYISSTELQNNPKSSNPIERDATLELDGGFGYSAELMMAPFINNLDLVLYVSSEYFKNDQNNLIFTLESGENIASVKMRETFYVVPLEIGVKWKLPVGSDFFGILIGGGGGIYFGDRERTVGSLHSKSIRTIPGFSMNILSGIDLKLARNFSASIELKFREAYFDVENKFDSDIININGIEYQLLNPFYSRIFVDGVRVSLGLKYNF